MYGDEQAFLKWIESLERHYGRGTIDDFRAEVIGRLSRISRRHEQDVRDMEAARLLPHGVSVVVEAQGCHRSTAYRRVSRAQKVARQIPDATTA